tara:strand:+ start:951 stop:8678 length:7728 start_codon:yes stop_codon:yes gene_type:complete
MDDKKKWTIDLKTDNGLLEPFQANLRIETSMEAKRTIDVFGEVIDESEIYSDVDRYFDICDSSVELGFSLTDLKNTLKFRSVKTGSKINDTQISGFYVKNSKESAMNHIAKAIDQKIINWVVNSNNQVSDKSNDFHIATQLRVVDSGDKFLVTHINPNANNKTKGFDGKPLGEMTGALLSDVLYRTPEAYQTLSSPYDLSSSLAHNKNGIGKQFINELFKKASVPADKVNNSDTSAFYCGQELDIPENKNNKNLYQLVSQLMQSNPERFQNLDTSKDYVPLPIKEGDEVSFILSLAIEIGAVDNTQEHTKALYQLVKSGIAVDEAPSFEKPVISSPGETSKDNYSLRKCKFLLTFRCTNTDAERKQDITNKIASFTQICDPVMKTAQTLVNNVEKIEDELKECEDRMDDSNKDCDKQQLVVNNNTAIIDGAGDKNVYGGFDFDNYMGSKKMNSNAIKDQKEAQIDNKDKSDNWDEKELILKNTTREKNKAEKLLKDDMTALSHADQVLENAKKKHLISSERVNGRGNEDHVGMNHENYMGTVGVFDSKSKAFDSAEKAHKTAVSNGINSESEKKAMEEALKELSAAQKAMMETSKELGEDAHALDIAQKDRKIKYDNVYGRQKQGEKGTIVRDDTKYMGSDKMVKYITEEWTALTADVANEEHKKEKLETDENAISTMKGKIENYYASDMKYLDSMKAALSEADRVHNEANELVDGHKETLKQLEEEHKALVKILHDVQSTPNFTSDLQEKEAIKTKQGKLDAQKNDLEDAKYEANNKLKDLDIARANKTAAYQTVYGRQKKGDGNSVRDASKYMGSVKMVKDASEELERAKRKNKQTKEKVGVTTNLQNTATKAAEYASKIYVDDLKKLKSISSKVTSLKTNLTDLENELEPLYSIAHEKNKNLKEAIEILDAIMKLPGIVITDEKRDEIDKLEDKMQIAKQNYYNDTDGEGLLELYETAKTEYDESLVGFKSTTTEENAVTNCKNKSKQAIDNLNAKSKELDKCREEYTSKKNEKVAIYKTIYGRQEQDEKGTNVRDASNYLGSDKIAGDTNDTQKALQEAQEELLESKKAAEGDLTDANTAILAARKLYKNDKEELGAAKLVLNTNDVSMKSELEKLTGKKEEHLKYQALYKIAEKRYNSVKLTDWESIKTEENDMNNAKSIMEEANQNVVNAENSYKSKKTEYDNSVNAYNIIYNNIYGRKDANDTNESFLREDNYMGSKKMLDQTNESLTEATTTRDSLVTTVAENLASKDNAETELNKGKTNCANDKADLRKKEDVISVRSTELEILKTEYSELKQAQSIESANLESLKEMLNKVINTVGVQSYTVEEGKVQAAEESFNQAKGNSAAKKDDLDAKKLELENAKKDKTVAYQYFNGKGDKTDDNRTDDNYKGTLKILNNLQEIYDNATSTLNDNTASRNYHQAGVNTITTLRDQVQIFVDQDEKELGVNNGENSTGAYRELRGAQKAVSTKQIECDGINESITSKQDEYDDSVVAFEKILAITNSETSSEKAMMDKKWLELKELKDKLLESDNELAENKGKLEEEIEKVNKAERNLKGAGEKNTGNREFDYDYYMGSLRIFDLRVAEGKDFSKKLDDAKEKEANHANKLAVHTLKNKEAIKFNAKNIKDLGVPSSPGDADIEPVVATGFYKELEEYNILVKELQSKIDKLTDQKDNAEDDYKNKKNAYETIAGIPGSNSVTEQAAMDEAEIILDNKSDEIDSAVKERDAVETQESNKQDQIDEMKGTINGRGSKDPTSVFHDDSKYKGSKQMDMEMRIKLEEIARELTIATHENGVAESVVYAANKDFLVQDQNNKTDIGNLNYVQGTIDKSNEKIKKLSEKLNIQNKDVTEKSERYNQANKLYEAIFKIKGANSDTELAAKQSAEELLESAETDRDVSQKNINELQGEMRDELNPHMDYLNATLYGRQDEGAVGTVFRSDIEYMGSKEERDQIIIKYDEICKELDYKIKSLNKMKAYLKETTHEKWVQETFHDENVELLGVRSCEADDSESIYPVAAKGLYKQKEVLGKQLDANTDLIDENKKQEKEASEELEKLTDAYNAIFVIPGSDAASEKLSMDNAQNKLNDVLNNHKKLIEQKMELHKEFDPLVNITIPALEKTINGRQGKEEEGTTFLDASEYMGSEQTLTLAIKALIQATQDFKDATRSRDEAVEVLNIADVVDKIQSSIYNQDLVNLGVPSYEGDDDVESVEATGVYAHIENAKKDEETGKQALIVMHLTATTLFNKWQEARNTYLTHLQDDYVSIDEEKEAMTNAWDKYVKYKQFVAKNEELQAVLSEYVKKCELDETTYVQNINGRGNHETKERDINGFRGVQNIHDELVTQRMDALRKYDSIRNSGDDAEIARAWKVYEDTNDELNSYKKVLDEQNDILSKSKIALNNTINLFNKYSRECEDKLVKFNLAKNKANDFVRRAVSTHLAKYNGLRERNLVLGEDGSANEYTETDRLEMSTRIIKIINKANAAESSGENSILKIDLTQIDCFAINAISWELNEALSNYNASSSDDDTAPLGDNGNSDVGRILNAVKAFVTPITGDESLKAVRLVHKEDMMA